MYYVCMYYSPMILGHMEEAHIVLQNKYHHLKKNTIDDIIHDEKARMFFAKFVSLLIRKSDIIASKRYHLDKSFRRINMEIGRVFRVFKSLKIRRRTIKPLDPMDQLGKRCKALKFKQDVYKKFFKLVDDNKSLKDLYYQVYVNDDIMSTTDIDSELITEFESIRNKDILDAFVDMHREQWDYLTFKKRVDNKWKDLVTKYPELADALKRVEGYTSDPNNRSKRLADVYNTIMTDELFREIKKKSPQGNLMEEANKFWLKQLEDFETSTISV